MSAPLSPTPPESPEPQAIDFDESALIDTAWQRNFVRPLLIILLAISMMLGPVALALRVTGETRFYALAPLLIVIAISSVYTRIWLADPRHRWFRETRTRLGEILILFVLLRLTVWFILRQSFSQEILLSWLEDPFQFFDNLFLVGMLLLLMEWYFAGTITLIFVDLGLRSDELIDYRKAGYERAWVQAIPSDRGALLQRFIEIWMWGGLLLVLTAALSRVTFDPHPGQWLGFRTLGLPPVMLMALFIYFIGGLLLLSQGRLAVLRARWHREGTPGIARVTRHWYGRTAKIILGVALLASLLPFGSSNGLAVIVSAIISIGFYLYLAFITLITLAFTALMSLLGGGASEEPLPPPPPAETAPPMAPPPPAAIALPAWATGALFWIALLALTVYLIARFLSSRGIRLDFWESWRALLAAWWNQFWSTADEVLIEARRRLQTSGVDVSLSLPSVPWRFIRLRALSPTERTRYFYLSIVRRAGELGMSRRQSQTPLEYEEDLRQQWPDLEPDLEHLTERFMQARYRAQPLDESEAGFARQAWEQLKRALRIHKKHGAESDLSPDEETP